MKNLLLSILVLAVLSACASGPSISSNVSPSVDFLGFQTYNFNQPLGTDRPDGTTTTGQRHSERFCEPRDGTPWAHHVG